MPSKLTYERAHEVLRYNPITGEFFWKIRMGGNAPAGGSAGTLNGKGYRIIQIDGKRYKCCRIAFLMHHGRWPRELVDHIDLNKSNDRIGNLREATRAQNQHNTSARARNTLGVKGVWRSRRGRFESAITAHGTRYHLGTFDTVELASAAYQSAAMRLHKDFARVS